MLSTTSTYALRALVALSSSPLGVAGARELASAAGVPQNYLSKILAELTRAGILTAKRGQGGGYGLGRPAERIRLIDVVSRFEPTTEETPCLIIAGKDCADDHPCTAHQKFASARDAYLSFLEQTTVSELATGMLEDSRPAGRARTKPRQRKGGARGNTR